MRILHVMSSLNQEDGGPLRAVLGLCGGDDNSGIASEIAGIGPLKVNDVIPGTRVHSFPCRFSASYRFSSAFDQWLASNITRFSGVILHGSWLYPNVAAYCACKRHRVPYAYFPHGMLERWSLYQQGAAKALKKLLYWAAVEQRIYRNAKYVLFTTRREMSMTESVLHSRRPSLLVVPYGQLSHRASMVQSVSGRLQKLKEVPFSLFLGRIHPHKNLELLLSAWTVAPPHWKLVIAGSGRQPYVDSIHALAKALLVEDRIVWAGFVSGDDKEFLLSHAQWNLIPSMHENFCVSALESLMRGCPVAISDQVYFSEFLHPESEIIPLRQTQWTSFVSTRMADERRRRQILEMDRTLVLPRFDPDHIAREWTNTMIRCFG